MKTDDAIFLLGICIIVGLILLSIHEEYVATVAGLFGSHKAGSILDDKFPDRNQTPPDV